MENLPIRVIISLGWMKFAVVCILENRHSKVRINNRYVKLHLSKIFGLKFVVKVSISVNSDYRYNLIHIV